MKKTLVMPKLGLTMTEGVITEWLVGPGERFDAQQIILLVEMEKATNEIVAEEAGVLLEIVQPEGATVEVGMPIARYEDVVAVVVSAPVAASPLQAPETSVPAEARAVTKTKTPRDSSPENPDRVLSTPLARRLANEGGIDIAMITGSGPHGRVKGRDVEDARAVAPEAAPAIVPTSMQAAMAKRLTLAKQTVPHFYLAREFDAGAIIELRAEIAKLSGAKITLNHFIVSAIGRALNDDKAANRVWRDGKILQFDTSDVGIAVHASHGLTVPILRNAGALALREVAQEAHNLVARARNHKLTAAEMIGGAISVSNAGMFNVTYVTPIINPGQGMILGVGSIRQVFRPDAQGQPLCKSEIGLMLACDHRIMDGVTGLRYLELVCAYLETPSRLWNVT
jgi:pyruvate dehydrogenase E2 component (dihydrolipoamide acetyltransferase)